MLRAIERIPITVNGEPRMVPRGASVAAALLGLGITEFRRSVTGEPRAPLCGMGICMECRVTVDGALHTLACQTEVCEGMTVRTDE
ncbi:MAG: (2Fe-2S)-binding protein [Bryobacterales bacterium]|nr:(2Fe-2S)-binding protein [Bryobacterales bacterium]